MVFISLKKLLFNIGISFCFDFCWLLYVLG
jgi:hypothetical protein